MYMTATVEAVLQTVSRQNNGLAALDGTVTTLIAALMHALMSYGSDIEVPRSCVLATCTKIFFARAAWTCTART